MAYYAASATTGKFTPSGQFQSDCLVSCYAPTTPPQSYELSTTVVVPLSAVATMNTAILNAAVAEIKRVYNLPANLGNTDAQGLMGGRSI